MKNREPSFAYMYPKCNGCGKRICHENNNHGSYVVERKPSKLWIFCRVCLGFDPVAAGHEATEQRVAQLIQEN